MFRTVEVELPNGQRTNYVRSTTDLDTAEFSNYVERTRRFLAEQGWSVPGPGEVIEACATGSTRRIGKPSMSDGSGACASSRASANACAASLSGPGQ